MATVTVLIQRQCDAPSRKTVPKGPTPPKLDCEIADRNRYWEDRFLLEEVTPDEATAKAQAVIEQAGAPDEVYRILLIGPVMRVACRSRVVVADITPQPLPKTKPVTQAAGFDLSEDEREDYPEEDEEG